LHLVEEHVGLKSHFLEYERGTNNPKEVPMPGKNICDCIKAICDGVKRVCNRLSGKHDHDD